MVSLFEGRNHVDMNDLDAFARVVKQSGTAVEGMIKSCRDALQETGFTDDKGNVKKSELIFYIAGGMVKEIGMKTITDVFKEYMCVESDYLDSSVALGALSQAMDIITLGRCMNEIHPKCENHSLPFCLFKQCSDCKGKLVLSDRNVMPIEYSPHSFIVDRVGIKYRLYAGNRKDMEGDFIDLNKAFFLCCLDWYYYDSPFEVQLKLLINEYGNITVVEHNDTDNAINRKLYCSIYSRNRRRDGRLSNDMDSTLAEFQKEYKEIVRDCKRKIVVIKINRYKKRFNIPDSDPEYQEVINSNDYDVLNAYLSRLIDVDLAVCWEPNWRQTSRLQMCGKKGSEIDFGRTSDHFNSCILLFALGGDCVLTHVCRDKGIAMPPLYGTVAPLRPIREIDFSILSPEEVIKDSVTEGKDGEPDGVYRVEIAVNGKPVRGGLNDPRLGTVGRSDVCETCHRKYEDCPGHFGHIHLNAEIFHVGFLEPMSCLARFLDAVDIVCCRACATTVDAAWCLTARSPISRAWTMRRDSTKCLSARRT